MWQQQQQMYKYQLQYRIMNMLLLKQSNQMHKQLQQVMYYMLMHLLDTQNINPKSKRNMKHIILMLSMIKLQNNLLLLLRIIRKQFLFKPNLTYKMQLLLQQLLMNKFTIQHYIKLYICFQLNPRNTQQLLQHWLH